ncbi:MAG TPA: arginine--tRNA ligase [Bacteroidales bacterium]|nr:arginine--tRNA ligase [Bacteroidales bacterium]HPS18250.1 arginine--tRNA ligase [Bacteroidales bacterium]
MITEKILSSTQFVLKKLYGQDIAPDKIQIEKTNPDFEGDFTLVVFPFLKISRKSPEATANEIGNELLAAVEELQDFKIVKGFLNLKLKQNFWQDFAKNNFSSTDFGKNNSGNNQTIVIEYSSPNTNKPLHLGHIRNNLLGWSVAEIMKANGYNVIKTNLVNDRGIHICKSMLAWEKWGSSETPESTGMKGDHLVGKYYVLFDKEYKKEIAELINSGKTEEEATREAPIIKEAQAMLLKWENGDEEIRNLWKTMNGWVYAGFDVTYKRMGIDFDKIQYESNTYILGKEIVNEGLQKNIFEKKLDGSVWINLTAEGFDEKILLRADGTSVYITQDIGTAQLRHDEFNADKLIYVVGNEQNYHFNILKLILKKAGRDWAERITHLSYGMVELPEGKMKSREGTVVDADDLLDEMYNTAKQTTEELGKTENFSKEKSDALFNMLGLGALKYFILKVDPKKNMTFNPKESIDFNGNTGPFIQYTHARICSLLDKAKENGYEVSKEIKNISLLDKEINLIRILHDYPSTVQQAGTSYSPSLVANYIYELAKEYNGFYQEIPVLKETDEEKIIFRLQLSTFVKNTISSAMKLLGIDVPEKM